jgi:glycosyltransferase involved in cell wall biosynthesis
MKKVLIGHQSTIPHYRVPFYNVLERNRPQNWCFEVIVDPSELASPRFYREGTKMEDFRFPIHAVKTYSRRILKKMVSYQTFWWDASKYDLVIVENAVNNLAYPLCQLHQLHGTKIAFWGHGRDLHTIRRSLFKSISESFKLIQVRWGDGFFAYTQGVKEYLENLDVPSEKIFVVNNTIDISEQRKAFEHWSKEREETRKKYGLTGKKVLLFVGRFTSDKRIDYLLKAFSILSKIGDDFRLILVGNGESGIDLEQSNILHPGSIIELEKLAPIYTASDLFVYPGAVGLGPLQALCYDLPVVTIESPNHKPEVEYLKSTNSIVLDNSTNPEDYAGIILELFKDKNRLNALKSGCWPSIRHLTIDQMADNFIFGINKILGY